MTPDEKREARKARHQVQAAIRTAICRKIGLDATNRQLEAGVKTLTDRFYKEQVSPAARAIENQIILEAAERARTAQ